MKIFKVIVQAIDRTLILAVFISIASGLGMAVLVATLSRQLTTTTPISGQTVTILALITLFAIGAELAGKWLMARAIGWTGYRLRMSLVRQLLAASYAQVETIGKVRLQAIFLEDVQHIVFAMQQIPHAAVAIATLVGSLIYLGWLAPTMLGILTLLAIPAMGGHLFLQAKSRAANRKVYKIRTRAHRYYEAAIEGWKELKLHNQRRYDFYTHGLAPTAALTQQLGISSRSWNYMASTWSQSIYFIFILIVIGIAVWQPSHNQVIASYALIILYIKGAVMTLLNNTAQWQEAEQACYHLEELGFILSTDPNLAAVQSAPQRPADKVQIELREVAYTYIDQTEERSFTLGPLSLTMQSGELIFCVGGNGSGKTTLIKLLTGLYTAESGTIHWNGQVVSAAKLEAYQQLFSVIFADFYLFDQLLGLDTLDQQARAYLDKLHLSHKVRIEQGVLSTTDLSYGQRKRLALLTAYLEDRPVYIFDEWAAGQDPEFRDLFYYHLLPELKERGKLVIVISHHDHYYAVADRIIKLDFGQLEADTQLTPQDEAAERASAQSIEGFPPAVPVLTR